MKIACISTIGRTWSPCKTPPKTYLARAFSTVRTVHVHFSACPRAQHRERTKSHASGHVPVKLQTRSQSTAVARDESASSSGLEEGNSAEESYTGTFDERKPTTAGIEALKNSPWIQHNELFNLTLFCSRVRKTYLRKPGSVVRFDSFPVWDAILPVLAERLGLQHILIKTGHPYYRTVTQSKVLHVLVNSKNSLADRRDDDAAEPLEGVLLSQVSSSHIRHWLDKVREVPATELQAYLLRLLMMACRYNLLALPILEVAPYVTESASNEMKRNSYRLKLSNENYDISIVRDVEYTPKVSANFLTDAVMHYIDSISKVLTPNTNESFLVDRSQWDYARILGRGLRALNWGTLVFEDEPVKGSFGELSDLDLWRCRIKTSRHRQLGPGVVWSGQKTARRMATFRACLLLKNELQDAYARGKLLPEEYREFALCWGEKVPSIKPRQLVPSTPSVSKTMTNEIQVNVAIVSAMVDTLRDLVKAGFESSYEGISSESSDLETEWRVARSLSKDRSVDDFLYSKFRQRSTFAKNDMPILPVRDDKICSNIIKTVKTSNITIITAATGSGKTTQIPQIILDEYISAQNGSMCNIVCTQPRRVSTISVANRVAFERRQLMGQEVGYKVRFDARPVRSGCGITYMTSGYLIRLLEADPLGILQSHSHIILDEVHTRDIDTDLLLTAIKNFFDGRVQIDTPVMPKIILMSATINAGFFQSYFENLEPRVKVSTIDVPGRAFAVEEKRLDQTLNELQESHAQHFATMLENSQVASYVNEQMQLMASSESESCDSELAANLPDDAKFDEVQAISKDLFVPTPLVHLLIVRLLSTTESGDILVFLPGLAEIEALEQLLLQSPLSQSEFSDSVKNKMFKLHSALYETNFDVFQAVPAGCRRVILATNIAETSITLADVKFVVDTGLSRGSTFDQITQSGTFGLQWISKAEVMQRRGRAGRTHAGVYYGTYSQAQYDSMADAPTPEILRTNLEHLVLRNASSQAFRLVDHNVIEEEGPGIVLAGRALLTGPSPPEKRFVAAAAKQLYNIRALNAEGNATPMGKILSRLPMNPAAGKAVLLGLIFKCFDALVVYGALREDFPLMFDPTAISAVVERRRILAGPNDDDRWADLQAFFLYDSRRRQRNNDAAIELKEALGLRHDAYCEYAQVSKQTFETIQPMLGIPKDDDAPWNMPRMFTPLFPDTPRYLNTNSPNADLVKSLALSTVGTRFAAWNHKHWRTHIHSRVLPRPNSVNHGGSRRGVLAQRLRREDGDLLAYGQMRIVSKDKYPWLHDTATATPLMAILFAESVSLVEEESTFVINGWVKYRLSYPVDEDVDTKRTAKIIWEYRKALDRFLAYAMQMISLNPYKLKNVRNGKLSPRDFNVFFGTKENEFRETIVNSVVKILGIDSEDRAERVKARATDEQGIAEKTAENNASKEYQDFETEFKPELMNAEEADPTTGNNADETYPVIENDDDGLEEQVVLKVVEKVKKQLKYVPVPVKQKPNSLRGAKKEELERVLQDMVRDVMTERLQVKNGLDER